MASSIVLASESQRRSALYHPSVWGNHFLIYDSKLSEIEENDKQQHQQLKEEVRRLVKEAAHKPCDTQTLDLIDAIQWLGVSYHFEVEIDHALRQIYHAHYGGNNGSKEEDGDEGDLYSVALRFRLLRQHGFSVPHEIFNKFKEGKANFKESLARDIRGMLSLYEAAELRIHGEDILDEANSFSTFHLESSTTHLSHPIVARVKRALNRPIHKGMERLEARNYISIYEEQDHHHKALLLFAKLDFNLLQKLHQKELAKITRWWKGLNFAEKLPFGRDRVVENYFWILGVYFEPQYFLSRRILTKLIALTSFLDDIYDVYGTIEELSLLTDAIERWDINSLSQLPGYMRVFYQALLDVYSEIEEEMMKEGKSFRVYYAKEAMKAQAKAYMAEAKWLHMNHVPTMEEYMSVALVSTGYPLLATASLVGMGNIVTEDTFKWISSNPKIIKASSIICRLMDDIVSHKSEQERGHVASAVECYMKEFDTSEEETVDEFRKRVRDAWKDINEEWLEGSTAPKDVLKRVVNLARMIDVIYKDEDGYTHAAAALKDHVAYVLIDSVPM